MLFRHCLSRGLGDVRVAGPDVWEDVSLVPSTNFYWRRIFV